LAGTGTADILFVITGTAALASLMGVGFATVPVPGITGTGTASLAPLAGLGTAEQVGIITAVGAAQFAGVQADGIAIRIVPQYTGQDVGLVSQTHTGDAVGTGQKEGTATAVQTTNASIGTGQTKGAKLDGGG
jgi:hypothetical protein